MQAADRRHDRVLGRGIDAGGRLVEQHDLGLDGERARDQHALLLAAGERPERLVRERREPDLRETVERAGALAPSDGRSGERRAYVPISTTSATVSGKIGSSASRCGT